MRGVPRGTGVKAKFAWLMTLRDHQEWRWHFGDRIMSMKHHWRRPDLTPEQIEERQARAALMGKSYDISTDTFFMLDDVDIDAETMETLSLEELADRMQATMSAVAELQASGVHHTQVYSNSLQDAFNRVVNAAKEDKS